MRQGVKAKQTKLKGKIVPQTGESPGQADLGGDYVQDVVSSNLSAPY